jgi:serine/threonine protein kinase
MRHQAIIKSPADFVLLKRGDYSIWIHRGLEETSIVDRLANPDRLFIEDGCVVLKDQKKIKVGRIPIDVYGQRRSVYIKRYNAFSLRAKVMSIFNRSGGVRSLQGAAILKRAGISTAMPVAAVESRCCGMVMKSFYISEEIVDGMTSDRYWQSIAKDSQRVFRRRRFLESLAAIFKMLHRRGVYHNDLKDANILVVSDKEKMSFFLLDLEGVRLYTNLNRRRRVKNLVQLNRTLGRLIRGTDKLYFLKVYLGSVFRNRLEKRRWVTEVLEQSRRRELKAQHVARQPF